MVALGIGLVLAALIGAGAFKAAKRAADQIEVTGSAKRSIRSDYAVWRVSVAAQAPALQDAYAEVTRNGQALWQFLAQSGVADSLITVKPVETSNIYRVGENGSRPASCWATTCRSSSRCARPTSTASPRCRSAPRRSSTRVCRCNA